MTVPAEFPEQSFDLIVMSEIGYFFSMPDLQKIKEKITNHLNNEGQLLLVHWTPFVHDFPLTGDQVHDFFLSQCGKDQPFKHLNHFRAEKYCLDLLEKN